MTDKLLSVKEAVDILYKNILDACFDSEDIELLISAVRREERERGAAIAETEGYFDLAKKILEEK